MMQVSDLWLCSWRVPVREKLSEPVTGEIMSKDKVKKAPQKTLKEKRREKNEKKKGSTPIGSLK